MDALFSRSLFFALSVIKAYIRYVKLTGISYGVTAKYPAGFFIQVIRIFWKMSVFFCKPGAFKRKFRSAAVNLPSAP